jgi:hypothetical protein
MMRDIVLRPSAAKLLESMRDIGYSFSSALSDIVDNSISAKAEWVRIFNDIDDAGQPFVAIIDNGVGMDEVELTAAMRHGSRSPRDAREAGDLGRFGLGLKTASFSQCRRLTVVSRKNGNIAARRWDLDRVVESDEWILSALSPHETGLVPLVDLVPDTGTMVVWQALDRLDALGDGPDAVRTAMNSMFADAGRNIALVFHRFIAPDPGHRSAAVVLSVNGKELEAADPFAQHMRIHADPHETENIHVAGGTIAVQAFTLPHHSRLTPSELESLSLGASLVETQGLYIYRGRRLIGWGNWLGLARRSAITKLLRVRVDVPTTLDLAWQVDVRKSRIRPPAAIRARLKPLVERMTESSKRPYTWRGERQGIVSGLPLWIRIEERGSIRYEINRDHPLIAAVLAGDGTGDANIETLLEGLQATLPLEAMFSDYGNEPQSVAQSKLDDDQLRRLLAAFVEAMEPNSDTLSAESAGAVRRTHPFVGDARINGMLAELRSITE